MMGEIDYLLETDAAGVKTYDSADGGVLEHIVREWLDTPLGSVWGQPHYGHRFIQFRHQPQGSDLEVAIELSIVSKLPKDTDLTPSFVRAEFLDIDLVNVIIGIKDIEIEKRVTL